MAVLGKIFWRIRCWAGMSRQMRVGVKDLWQCPSLQVHELRITFFNLIRTHTIQGTFCDDSIEHVISY